MHKSLEKILPLLSQLFFTATLRQSLAQTLKTFNILTLLILIIDTMFFRGNSVCGTLIRGKIQFVDTAKFAVRMLCSWKDLWKDSWKVPYIFKPNLTQPNLT